MHVRRHPPATRTTSTNHILLACTYFRVRLQENDDAVVFQELGVGGFGGRTGGRGWKMLRAISAIGGRRAGGLFGTLAVGVGVAIHCPCSAHSATQHISNTGLRH